VYYKGVKIHHGLKHLPLERPSIHAEERSYDYGSEDLRPSYAPVYGERDTIRQLRQLRYLLGTGLDDYEVGRDRDLSHEMEVEGQTEERVLDQILVIIPRLGLLLIPGKPPRPAIAANAMFKPVFATCPPRR